MLNPQVFELFDQPIPKVSVDKGINILYFSDRTFGNFLLHSHDFVEVILVVEGNISISAEGIRYPVKCGEIVIIPPGLLHCTIIEEGTSCYKRFVVHIIPEYLAEIIQLHEIEESDFNFLKEPCTISCTTESQWRLRNVFFETYRAIERSDKYAPALMTCYSMELMITILDLYENHDRSSERLQNPEVAAIIHFINQNYQDPDVDLSLITRQVNMSEGHLSRLFKEYAGTSIYNYVISKRLENSKKLIREGKSIIEACFDSGFTDYTSYLKSFKKSCSCTPKQYQKSNHLALA